MANMGTQEAAEFLRSLVDLVEQHKQTKDSLAQQDALKKQAADQERFNEAQEFADKSKELRSAVEKSWAEVHQKLSAAKPAADIVRQTVRAKKLDLQEARASMKQRSSAENFEAASQQKTLCADLEQEVLQLETLFKPLEAILPSPEEEHAALKVKLESLQLAIKEAAQTEDYAGAATLQKQANDIVVEMRTLEAECPAVLIPSSVEDASSKEVVGDMESKQHRTNDEAKQRPTCEEARDTLDIAGNGKGASGSFAPHRSQLDRSRSPHRSKGQGEGSNKTVAGSGASEENSPIPGVWGSRGGALRPAHSIPWQVSFCLLCRC
jgi:hypothetical protein